jgi:hypothetical protein
MSDDEWEGVRVIHGPEWQIAVADARDSFISLIEKEGFTVLPETMKRWWKTT